MTDDPDAAEKIEIDWTRAIAGSMAAVASAVLLSTLGAAGTILGAAIGSLVVTIASAMFAQGLSTRQRKRRQARRQKAAAEKVGNAQAAVLLRDAGRRPRGPRQPPRARQRAARRRA